MVFREIRRTSAWESWHPGTSGVGLSCSQWISNWIKSRFLSRSGVLAYAQNWKPFVLKSAEDKAAGPRGWDCWHAGITCCLESELSKLLQTDFLGTAAPILPSCVCPKLKQSSFQATVFALQTFLPICSPAVHHCLHSGINAPTPACQQSDSLKLL